MLYIVIRGGSANPCGACGGVSVSLELSSPVVYILWRGRLSTVYRVIVAAAEQILAELVEESLAAAQQTLAELVERLCSGSANPC